MGKKYIGSCSEKLHIIAFESGVVKIQNDVAESMYPHEKHVCAALRLDNDNANEKLEESDNFMTYQECRELHKKKRRLDNYQYGNVDFILGFSDVVERLWYIADRLVDREHNNTSPLLMEALLFIRENRLYWDLELVRTAFNSVRSQIVTQKMEE